MDGFWRTVSGKLAAIGARQAGPDLAAEQAAKEEEERQRRLEEARQLFEAQKQEQAQQAERNSARLTQARTWFDQAKSSVGQGFSNAGSAAQGALQGVGNVIGQGVAQQQAVTPAQRGEAVGSAVVGGLTAAADYGDWRQQQQQRGRQQWDEELRQQQEAFRQENPREAAGVGRIGGVAGATPGLTAIARAGRGFDRATSAQNLLAPKTGFLADEGVAETALKGLLPQNVRQLPGAGRLLGGQYDKTIDTATRMARSIPEGAQAIEQGMEELEAARTGQTGRGKRAGSSYLPSLTGRGLEFEQKAGEDARKLSAWERVQMLAGGAGHIVPAAMSMGANPLLNLPGAVVTEEALAANVPKPYAEAAGDIAAFLAPSGGFQQTGKALANRGVGRLAERIGAVTREERLASRGMAPWQRKAVLGGQAAGATVGALQGLQQSREEGLGPLETIASMLGGAADVSELGGMGGEGLAGRPRNRNLGQDNDYVGTLDGHADAEGVARAGGIPGANGRPAVTPGAPLDGLPEVGRHTVPGAEAPGMIDGRAQGAGAAGDYGQRLYRSIANDLARARDDADLAAVIRDINEGLEDGSLDPERALGLREAVRARLRQTAMQPEEAQEAQVAAQPSIEEQIPRPTERLSPNQPGGLEQQGQIDALEQPRFTDADYRRAIRERNRAYQEAREAGRDPRTDPAAQASDQAVRDLRVAAPAAQAQQAQTQAPAAETMRRVETPDGRVIEVPQQRRAEEAAPIAAHTAQPEAGPPNAPRVLDAATGTEAPRFRGRPGEPESTPQQLGLYRSLHRQITDAMSPGDLESRGQMVTDMDNAGQLSPQQALDLRGYLSRRRAALGGQPEPTAITVRPGEAGESPMLTEPDEALRSAGTPQQNRIYEHLLDTYEQAASVGATETLRDANANLPRLAQTVTGAQYDALRRRLAFLSGGEEAAARPEPHRPGEPVPAQPRTDVPEPTMVRSELGGRAPAGERAGVWYSQLERVIEAKFRQGRMPAAQLRQLLLGNGVKKEELYWTGTDALLDRAEQAGTPVDRQQLLQHVQQNRLPLVESVLGYDRTGAETGPEAEAQRKRAVADLLFRAQQEAAKAEVQSNLRANSEAVLNRLVGAPRTAEDQAFREGIYKRLSAPPPTDPLTGEDLPDALLESEPGRMAAAWLRELDDYVVNTSMLVGGRGAGPEAMNEARRQLSEAVRPIRRRVYAAAELAGGEVNPFTPKPAGKPEHAQYSRPGEYNYTLRRGAEQEANPRETLLRVGADRGTTPAYDRTALDEQKLDVGEFSVGSHYGGRPGIVGANRTHDDVLADGRTTVQNNESQTDIHQRGRKQGTWDRVAMERAWDQPIPAATRADAEYLVQAVETELRARAAMQNAMRTMAAAPDTGLQRTTLRRSKATAEEWAYGTIHGADSVRRIEKRIRENGQNIDQERAENGAYQSALARRDAPFPEGLPPEARAYGEAVRDRNLLTSDLYERYAGGGDQGAWIAYNRVLRDAFEQRQHAFEQEAEAASHDEDTPDSDRAFQDAHEAAYEMRDGVEGAQRHLDDAATVSPEGYPRAPFPDNTITEKLLERQLRDAVDRGAEAISWSTGQVIARRWSAGRIVQRAAYEPATQTLRVVPRAENGGDHERTYHVPPEQLPQYVGDTATAYLTDPANVGPDGTALIDGEDILVADSKGRTMARQYDQIMVGIANKLGKPAGVAVERTTLRPPDDHDPSEDADLDVWVLPINDALRKRVQEGFALYHKVAPETGTAQAGQPERTRQDYEQAGEEAPPDAPDDLDAWDEGRLPDQVGGPAGAEVAGSRVVPETGEEGPETETEEDLDEEDDDLDNEDPETATEDEAEVEVDEEAEPEAEEDAGDEDAGDEAVAGGMGRDAELAGEAGFTAVGPDAQGRMQIRQKLRGEGGKTTRADGVTPLYPFKEGWRPKTSGVYKAQPGEYGNAPVGPDWTDDGTIPGVGRFAGLGKPGRAPAFPTPEAGWPTMTADAQMAAELGVSEGDEVVILPPEPGTLLTGTDFVYWQAASRGRLDDLFGPDTPVEPGDARYRWEREPSTSPEPEGRLDVSPLPDYPYRERLERAAPGVAQANLAAKRLASEEKARASAERRAPEVAAREQVKRDREAARERGRTEKQRAADQARIDKAKTPAAAEKLRAQFAQRDARKAEAATKRGAAQAEGSLLAMATRQQRAQAKRALQDAHAAGGFDFGEATPDAVIEGLRIYDLEQKSSKDASIAAGIPQKVLDAALNVLAEGPQPRGEQLKRSGQERGAIKSETDDPLKGIAYTSKKTGVKQHFDSLYELLLAIRLDSDPNVATWTKSLSQRGRVRFQIKPERRFHPITRPGGITDAGQEGIFAPDFLVTYTSGKQEVLEVKHAAAWELDPWKVPEKVGAAREKYGRRQVPFRIFTEDQIGRRWGWKLADQLKGQGPTTGTPWSKDQDAGFALDIRDEAGNVVGTVGKGLIRVNKDTGKVQELIEGTVRTTMAQREALHLGEPGGRGVAEFNANAPFQPAEALDDPMQGLWPEKAEAYGEQAEMHNREPLPYRGSTYWPGKMPQVVKDRLARGEDVWMVAVFPDYSQDINETHEFNAKGAGFRLAQFHAESRDPFNNFPFLAIGTWAGMQRTKDGKLDPNSKAINLDLSIPVADRETAMRLAERFRQQSIFNLRTKDAPDVDQTRWGAEDWTYQDQLDAVREAALRDPAEGAEGATAGAEPGAGAGAEPGAGIAGNRVSAETEPGAGGDRGAVPGLGAAPVRAAPGPGGVAAALPTEPDLQGDGLPGDAGLAGDGGRGAGVRGAGSGTAAPGGLGAPGDRGQPAPAARAHPGAGPHPDGRVGRADAALGLDGGVLTSPVPGGPGGRATPQLITPEMVRGGAAQEEGGPAADDETRWFNQQLSQANPIGTSRAKWVVPRPKPGSAAARDPRWRRQFGAAQRVTLGQAGGLPTTTARLNHTDLAEGWTAGFNTLQQALIASAQRQGTLDARKYERAVAAGFVLNAEHLAINVPPNIGRDRGQPGQVLTNPQMWFMNAVWRLNNGTPAVLDSAGRVIEEAIPRPRPLAEYTSASWKAAVAQKMAAQAAEDIVHEVTHNEIQHNDHSDPAWKERLRLNINATITEQRAVARQVMTLLEANDYELLHQLASEAGAIYDGGFFAPNVRDPVLSWDSMVGRDPNATGIVRGRTAQPGAAGAVGAAGAGAPAVGDGAGRGAGAGGLGRQAGPGPDGRGVAPGGARRGVTGRNQVQPGDGAGLGAGPEARVRGGPADVAGAEPADLRGGRPGQPGSGVLGARALSERGNTRDSDAERVGARARRDEHLAALQRSAGIGAGAGPGGPGGPPPGPGGPGRPVRPGQPGRGAPTGGPSALPGGGSPTATPQPPGSYTPGDDAGEPGPETTGKVEKPRQTTWGTTAGSGMKLGMLLSVKGLGRQLVGNVATIGWQPAERALAGGLANIGERKAGQDLRADVPSARESLAMLRSYWDNKGAAWAEAKKSLSAEHETEQSRLQRGATGKDAERLAATGPVHKRVQGFVDGGFRVLGIFDAATKYAAAAAEEAALQARNDLRARQGKATLTDAQIKEAVKNTEAYRSLTQEMDRYGKAVNGFRELPGGKLVIPFWEIPYNGMKYDLERSPVGLVRTALQHGKDAKTGDLEKQNRTELYERYARGTLGSFISLGILAAYASGNITGPEPEDPEELKRWRAEGKQPFSLRVGSRWQPVTMFPGLNSSLTQAATIGDFWRRHDLAGTKWDAAEYQRLVARFINTNASYSINRPFFEGVSDIISSGKRQAVGAGEDDGVAEALVRQGTSAVSGLYGGRIWRELEQATSDQERSPRDPIERMMAGIPGLSGQVPEARTAYGNRIKRTGSGQERFWNPLLGREGYMGAQTKPPRRYVGGKSGEQETAIAEAYRKVKAEQEAKDERRAVPPGDRPTNRERVLADQYTGYKKNEDYNKRIQEEKERKQAVRGKASAAARLVGVK